MLRYVSGILRRYRSEATNTVIRLPVQFRWFEDETDVVPSYDVIASDPRSCFDPFLSCIDGQSALRAQDNPKGSRIREVRVPEVSP